MNKARLIEKVRAELHRWHAMQPPEERGPALAQRLNVNWPGPAPLPFLWCKATALPAGVSYLADMEAIRLAYAFLKAATRIAHT